MVGRIAYSNTLWKPTWLDRYLDGRYFYIDESGYGRSTCGIAHADASRCIQQLQAISQYVSPEWLIRLSLAKSNPSVRGFILEKIVIAHLLTRDCSAAGPAFFFYFFL